MLQRLVALIVTGCFSGHLSAAELVPVRIRVTDARGAPIKAWRKVDLFSVRDSNGREWNTKLESEVSLNLPPGKYTVTVHPATQEKNLYQRTIQVEGPHLDVLIGVEDGPLLESTTVYLSTLKARFKQKPKQVMWCELSALYLDERYFARIEDSADLLIPNVEPGAYLLICGVESSRLAVVPVVIPLEEQYLEIDLDQATLASPGPR